MGNSTANLLLSGAIGSVLLLLLSASAAPVPDDEACTTSGVNNTFGAWGHGDCDTNAPVCSGTTQCTPMSEEESPDVWVSFCGCDGAGGEPECCHMVLRSRNSGEFLPFAEGKCKGQASYCPEGNTCGYTTSGNSRDAECTTEDLPL